MVRGKSVKKKQNVVNEFEVNSNDSDTRRAINKSKTSSKSKPLNENAENVGTPESDESSSSGFLQEPKGRKSQNE